MSNSYLGKKTVIILINHASRWTSSQKRRIFTVLASYALNVPLTFFPALYCTWISITIKPLSSGVPVLAAFTLVWQHDVHTNLISVTRCTSGTPIMASVKRLLIYLPSSRSWGF